MFANFPWTEFLIIWGLGMLGTVLVIPYSLALSRERQPQSSLPLPALLALSLLQNGVILGLAVGLGLVAARATGLGAPFISAWAAGRSALAGLADLLPLAVGAGLLVGALLVALELAVFLPHLPEKLRQMNPQTGPFNGFLASFYGAFTEEILTRLFLFSGAAWLLGLFWQAPGGQPAAGAFWSANLLAALLFGLAHLPATAAVTPLTPLVVTRALVLNGFAGLVFGLVYWRFGLEAAMVAHFSADIVLHVITPFVYQRRAAARVLNGPPAME